MYWFVSCTFSQHLIVLDVRFAIVLFRPRTACLYTNDRTKEKRLTSVQNQDVANVFSKKKALIMTPIWTICLLGAAHARKRLQIHKTWKGTF